MARCADHPAGTSTSRRTKPASKRRKLIRVFVIPLAIVMAFFLLLEGSLRVFGWGYPTGLVIKVGDNYQNNPCFGWRFFPQSIARRPMPIHLPADKAENTYRIFILGASAAQGFPQPAFGFSRILEVMLRKQFPIATFEVVNTAVTAINSHVVVDVARDCAKLEPDLFIVLLGNNEVIGPYGPTATFGGQSTNRWVIRTSLRIKTTRTGQLVESLIKGVQGYKEPIEWQGMRTFLKHRLLADDPRLTTVYDHFRANLVDICRAGEGADAGVILCTVPVNLRDSAPFASMHRPGLSAGAPAAWSTAYAAGEAHQEQGDPARAIQQFLAAEKIDGQYADVHFRMAQCNLALGQLNSAGERFALARHWDALRFRADDRINNTIRQVAHERGDSGVALLDAERVFAEAESVVAGSPGAELFHEHVHFNFDGQYLLARALFDKVVAALPQAVRNRQSAGPVPSTQQCAEALALTDWNRRRNLIDMSRMVATPPFTGQLNNGETRRRIAAALRQLRARTTKDDLTAAAAAYDRAIQAAPQDHWLRHQAAQLALMRRDNAAAARHLKKTIALAPGNAEAYLHLATTYLRQGNGPDAKATFKRFLQEARSTSAAYKNVIDIYTHLQLFDQAEAYCRQGLSQHPKNVLLLNMLGETLYKKQAYDEAIEVLRQALQEDTEYALTRVNLGVALAAKGRLPEGIEQLSAAVRRDPFLSTGHFSLGTAQVQMRRLDLGFAHIAKAVELDPENLQMIYENARLLQLHGRTSQAVRYYRHALSINPDHPPTAGRLAWVLATSADETIRNAPQAVELAERSVRLSNGRLPQAWATLAAAYAANDQFDKAIEAATQAIALAQRSGHRRLVQEVQRHLTRYRRAEALSESPSSATVAPGQANRRPGRASR